MKRIISAFFLLGALLIVACNKPKEVPDKILGQIFHDAMLVNAYLNMHNDFKLDSLNIYEPIFAEYGYTTEDVQYTINNFSRRKSIRLSDVAEYMISLLEQESSALADQVNRQDTIENVAARRFTRTILSDTTIVIAKDEDSLRMRYRLGNISPGFYRISGSYTLDSLDREPNRRMYIYFEREDSTRRAVVNGTLQRRRELTFNQEQTITEADSAIQSLVIDFFHYAREPKKRKVPSMTIHNVKVTYRPPIEECVEMLFREQSQMRIFSDSLINLIESPTAR
jgi:hypothetical protein